MSGLSIINLIILLATILSFQTAIYSFTQGYVTAYGDAESHLNISKRVIHSLTPGFSQLGGIWLPLPHLLMIPFVYFDFLWRSGLAGWIVSGAAYVISGVFLYKTTFLLTKNIYASIVAFLVFALNPNILYLQSTPMTELPLITFFIMSTYFFIKFLSRHQDLLSLMFAAFFGFCATLTRYDGWFLVGIEALVILIYYLVLSIKNSCTDENITQSISLVRKTAEGKFILFSTLAFFGIFLWLMWDFIILGDPFYFKNSQFSAQSQQQSWFIRGELPAYKDISAAIVYYVVTAAINSGVITFIISVIGFLWFLLKERNKVSFFALIIFQVPLFFNILTLYLGQSVIFIPTLTPVNFEWDLFNVRYGVALLPTIAFFFGYLFFQIHLVGKTLLVILFMSQMLLFATGYEKVISWEDGVLGLSAAKTPDAQEWLAQHYDGGLILLDDYARTISIIKSNLTMQNVIYIGNKPYWEESLEKPEKYATWIVMQKDDTVWMKIYEDPKVQARLFKYFQKAYTSPEVLIFKRNDRFTAVN